ncbi:hypothetical protein BD769DRAFT_1362483 [Suillus cothurnatus]|nr:hypothetical protein BD769DRAFT_1362483 [Suillus cothurnatus]
MPPRAVPLDDHGREIYKRCRHSPACYKFVSASMRRKHYTHAHTDETLDSDLGSKSGSENSDDHDHGASEDVHPGAVVAQYSRSDSSTNSDTTETMSVEMEPDTGNNYNFHEDDVDENAILTIEDMVAELEDWKGPTKAEEMHKICKFVFSVL